MRKFQLVAEIQDKDSEIERWKTEYRKLDDKYEHALRIIEDQQTLLTRAADALSGGATWQIRDELIRDLRKAAE